MRRPRTPTLPVAVASVALAAVLAACRDDSTSGDSATFCEHVEDNLDRLRASPETPEDVEAIIALWEDVGDSAPLSIEPDWNAHILLFETARDADDMEEIYARIYATERSSVAVAAWVRDHCGFEWGPVSTIVPQTTTTVAAPTTIAS
ncbi:MAG: hypothetical protein ICV72_04145 [Aldersonia sp.]|nr:hypothetical protein [Aldersonia sp.]